MRANACMGEGGGSRSCVRTALALARGLDNAYQNPFSEVLHGRKSHLLTVESENYYCKKEDSLFLCLTHCP